jgi:uncharacterized protein
MIDINRILCEEFKLKPFQVENTVKLIDEGNTIPFIARYRKEQTGSLDDVVLRDLFERLTYLRNLELRKEEVLRLIEEQGNLSSSSISCANGSTSLTAKSLNSCLAI